MCDVSCLCVFVVLGVHILVCNCWKELINGCVNLLLCSSLNIISLFLWCLSAVCSKELLR